MKINIPHKLGATEAQNRITKLLTNIKAQYGSSFTDLVENWTGNKCDYSFQVQKLNIKGNCSIEEKEVVIVAELPFFAKMFEGMIESKIKEEAEKLLA